MNAKSLLFLIVSLLLTFQLSYQTKIVKVVVPDNQNSGVLQNSMTTTSNQGTAKTSKTTVVKTVTTSTTNVEPTIVQPVYTQAVVTESTLVQPVYYQTSVTEKTYGWGRRHEWINQSNSLKYSQEAFGQNVSGEKSFRNEKLIRQQKLLIPK